MFKRGLDNYLERHIKWNRKILPERVEQLFVREPPGIANCVTRQETSQTIVENRTRFPVSRFLRNFFQVSLSRLQGGEKEGNKLVQAQNASVRGIDFLFVSMPFILLLRIRVFATKSDRNRDNEGVVNKNGDKKERISKEPIYTRLKTFYLSFIYLFIFLTVYKYVTSQHRFTIIQNLTSKRTKHTNKVSG